jgi:hypothetical protein
MAGFEKYLALLHRLRIRLYPNYLTDTGKYIARVATERSVSIEEICANLRERSSFQGNAEEAAYNVRQFCDECGFLVCDGWSINMKYYSISPHVGGVWNSADEVHDREKHPIGFTFRTLKPLRELTSRISVEVESIEEFAAYIDTVEDADTGAINETLTIGSEMIVSGHRIKIEGDDPSCGLYLVSQSDGTTHKITRRLAVNSGAKLITIVPVLTVGDKVKVRIVTQYSGSKTLLKEARQFESAAILSVVAAQPVEAAVL